MPRTIPPARRLLLALLTASWVWAGAPAREDEPARPRRPNIVFVLMDDLRWDELGCTGHPFVKTPHIDRIAREGALFRNAFATTPLCSPSRASILTGLYPHAHGIRDNTNHDALSHRLVTFPKLLHDAGYATGVRRQVAHGHRRLAAAGVRPLGRRSRGRGSTSTPS